MAADSSGAGDLVLAEVSSSAFDLSDGNGSSWIYTFYSPTTQAVVLVLIQNISGTFTMRGWARQSLGIEPPFVALDTTGAFVASGVLATKLMANAEFQRYRLDHPSAGAPSVRLTMSPERYSYAPSGFAPGEAVWRAMSDRDGDSVFVCFYATGTDTLTCGTHFYVEADYQTAESFNSNVDFGVTNFGVFGGMLDGFGIVTSAGFTVPAGSGRNYIYGAGFWVGARRTVESGTQTLCVQSYNPNNGGSDMQPGDGYDPRTSYSHPNLYLSTWYDGETGQPVALQGEFAWPLWLPAGVPNAQYMDPGIFVMKAEDRVAGATYARPAMQDNVSEHFVSRYSDSWAGRSGDTTARPIGLQFEENVYGNPDGFDYTVFVSYMMINKSSDTLRDVVFAPVFDFDIGDATNDRTRFYSEMPELRSAVAWSAAESGGLPFGTLAITMLEAPMVDGEGFVDNTLRSEYRTAGRLGGYRSWTLQTDPTSVLGRYIFMGADRFDADQGAADRRGLLASQRFAMAPGDTAHFGVSYTAFRQVASAPAANATIEGRLDNLIKAYYGIEAAGIHSPVIGSGALDLSASPNPARDRVVVRFTGSSRSRTTITLYSSTGAVVLARDLGLLFGGAHVEELDLGGFPAGVYSVVVASGADRSSVPVVVVR